MARRGDGSLAGSTCVKATGVHLIKVKQTLKAAAAAGVLVVAAAVPAMAVVESVGGGTWGHGAGTATVWSDYHHGSECHGSTSVGTYTDRASAAAGSTSITTAPVKLSGNETYYRTTC
jgi:hypothetical protein